jgi:fumarate reductase subunit D
MATVPTSATKPTTVSNNTLMAVLAYFGILVLVLFLIDVKKDPFVKFHIKQGLVLFILEIVTMLISGLPGVGGLLSNLLGIACVVLSIVGIINAVSGKTTELPVVGTYAKYFTF